MIEKYKVEHVEAALRKHHGIISKAAKTLKCDPHTIRRYIARHKRLAQTLDDIVQENLDITEDGLMVNIKKGNVTAQIFYLKTKGRDRGYVERVGYVDKDDQPTDPASDSQVYIYMPDNGRDPELVERLNGEQHTNGHAKSNGHDPE